MSREIKAFKLISGEEIIAKVKETTDGGWIVSDVLGLMAQQTPQGVQVGLVPFFMSNAAADDFELLRSAVVGSASPSNELEKGYIQQTSGIEIATTIQ